MLFYSLKVMSFGTPRRAREHASMLCCLALFSIALLVSADMVRLSVDLPPNCPSPDMA